MNKRQTVWLIVRLIGVFFAYWAVVALLGLIGAVYAYVSLPSATSSTRGNTNTARQQIPTPTINPAITPVKTQAEEAAEKASGTAGKEILWQLFLTALYGAIGWYLIKNGTYLFAVLNREDLLDETGEVSQSISSSLPQKTEQSVPMPDVPSRKEEVTSLNLTEYVPKSARVEPSAPSEVKTEETSAEVLPEQVQPEVSSLTEEQKLMNENTEPMNEITETQEISVPATEPVIADEDTTRMDYSLPAAEENQTETQSTPTDDSNNPPTDEQK